MNRLYLTVGCALTLVLGLACSSCGWITERSMMGRAILWMDADMGDIDRFPARVIAAGEGTPFAFAPATPGRYDGVFAPLVVQRDQASDTVGLDAFLESRQSWTFLVLRLDTLVYERGFAGHDGGEVETTFSVSKSLVSLGVGLAIDRGLIASVHDPITTYLPELAQRDPRFERVTLEHLLTMTSGVRFERSKMPWGDEARSYYHPDLRSVALSRDISGDAGTDFRYNFYNPLLVGLAVERASGMSLSALLSEGIWSRIGAEADASWSLDSRKHGFEKMESGFNAAPRDLLRLGRLVLHEGRWNGEALLSADWVRASVTAGPLEDRYGYFWWVNPVEGQHPSWFAEGRFGQFIYVVPDLELVMVRTGSEDGDVRWPSVFELVARRVRELDQGAPT
ncbi:MAG: serine hydrolase [Gemmatimonadota bacterium]